MGKSTISTGPFSIAMLNYQRVINNIPIIIVIIVIMLEIKDIPIMIVIIRVINISQYNSVNTSNKKTSPS